MGILDPVARGCDAARALDARPLRRQRYVVKTVCQWRFLPHDLGSLLALTVTPANESERSQVEELAARVQEVTGDKFEIAFVDQGHTGDEPDAAASEHGIELVVVKHNEPKRGFLLLPRRWVIERTFGWLGRFRRLARDYERLATTLKGWHWLASLVILHAKVGIQGQ